MQALSSEHAAMVSVPDSSGLREWLEQGAGSHGERYAEIRRRLVWYFERWNREDPAALTDETFRRVSGMLAHAAAIGEPPARYCYLVAREILLEDLARHGQKPQGPPRPRRLGDLDRRLQELPAAHRALVIEYYRDARPQVAAHRRRVAERMGLTPDAVGQRAARIREKLLRRSTSTGT